MDLVKAILELSAQKKQLDAAIATLESLLNGSAPVKAGKKRGRKQMSPEERRIVSARMSKYWASRRRQQNE
jgi:hypothetical protein